MRRSLVSSAAVAIAILLSSIPGTAAAQAGARTRGDAPVEGHAVRRSGAPPQSQAPQPPEPGRVQPPPAAAPPGAQLQARPAEIPRGIAATRVVPRTVAPPQNARPLYQPNYRPDYRSSYRPDYRPYYRPYYSFLPRAHVRFGLWAGYPVAYPVYLYPTYLYPAPYPGPSYPPAAYPAPGAVSIGAVGGLSFDIAPADARIYVDMQYAGVAAQFSPTEPPLSLAPGRHHVEIHASGFEVIEFDVDIVPGEVIPYQGELRRF